MKQVQLSDRLLTLASYVKKGERVADIGTDHGLLPIYLKQKGISGFIIAGDINPGPLEKMAGNLERHLPGEWEDNIQMRLGSGLGILHPGEVDCAIIAGMGGKLMIEILEDSMDVTCSLKRLVLQPRNAQDTLRKWLLLHGFRINDEVLVRERKYIWEILEVFPPEKAAELPDATEIQREQYDIGLELIRKKDPLLYDFIEQKAGIEQEILDGAMRSDLESAKLQQKVSERKLSIFRRIQKDVCQNG